MATRSADEAKLPKESAAAYRILPYLLPAHEGKWALFRQDGLYDICESFEAAMELGYRTFRRESFLAVEIVPDPSIADLHQEAGRGER